MEFIPTRIAWLIQITFQVMEKGVGDRRNQTPLDILSI